MANPPFHDKRRHRLPRLEQRAQALEQEAMNALSGDLLRVRKRGEQAGTLLLIPILMLFALTLVIVVAPALMQMQLT